MTVALYEAMHRDPIEVILWDVNGQEIERGVAKRNEDGTATYTPTRFGAVVHHVTVNGVIVPLAHQHQVLPGETITTPRLTLSDV
jgi:hypothetical protein